MTLNLEVTSIPDRLYLYLSHIMNPKACTTGQIDASHWESSVRNEAYQHTLEEVNELAKMLVSTAIP